MMAQFKKARDFAAKQKPRPMGDGTTRLSIESARFSNSQNTEIALIGLNTLGHSIADLATCFGSTVHILTETSTEGNQSDVLASRNQRIRTHRIDPKIINTALVALKGVPVAVFPAYLSSDFLEGFEMVLPALKDSAKSGDLKRLIIIHGGYQMERAGKKPGELITKFKKLEERANDIHDGLKVITIRYAPTFEMLGLLSCETTKANNFVFKFPLPHQGIPFICDGDIKDSLVRILADPAEHDNQVYSLCGDERLTSEMIIQSITAASGTETEITFERAPSSELSSPLNHYGGQNLATLYIEYFNNLKFLTKQSTDLSTILNKDSFTFQDWALLHSHIWV